MMFINIFFRILNFCILASFFYYVTQQFIMPFIMKMMTEYDIYIRNLIDDTQNLSNESKALVEQTNDQKLRFQVMQTKFLLWQEKCYQRKQLLHHEQEQIEQAIQHRFDIRSNVVNHELAAKEQLPCILDRVTISLQKKYHKVEHQKQYITELIHVMKERS